MAIENFLYVFVAWVLGNIMSYFVGRGCSSYFPCLISSKIYFTIKSPKLQEFLIRRYLNRSLEVEVAEEDRNKLSLIGGIYYAVIALLTVLGYIALICFQVGYVLSINSLSFFREVFGHIIASYIPFMGGMSFLYKMDYYIGKRIQP